MPKTVLIKAIDPCSIEMCIKDFDGVKVEAHRQAFDCWDDLELAKVDGLEHPSLELS